MIKRIVTYMECEYGDYVGRVHVSTVRNTSLGGQRFETLVFAGDSGAEFRHPIEGYDMIFTGNDSMAGMHRSTVNELIELGYSITSNVIRRDEKAKAA